jgi:hypothetical protein
MKTTLALLAAAAIIFGCTAPTVKPTAAKPTSSAKPTTPSAPAESEEELGAVETWHAYNQSELETLSPDSARADGPRKPSPFHLKAARHARRLRTRASEARPTSMERRTPD